MDITNIENEWNDLKDKRRPSDTDNILKELNEEKKPRNQERKVKKQIKGLVRSILEEDPYTDKGSKDYPPKGRCPWQFETDRSKISLLLFCNYRGEGFGKCRYF